MRTKYAQFCADNLLIKKQNTYNKFFSYLFVQDATVEVLAASNNEEQLKGYAAMLVGGLFITMLLKFFELRGHKWTIHPST